MDFMHQTQRLILRPFSDLYLEDYQREFTAEVTKYQYPDPFPDREAARRALSGFVEEMERGEMLELVILSWEEEFLGSLEVFGLREEAPELGLWLKKAAWGKGYGYEALKGILAVLGKAGKYPFFLYEADVRNTPSIRLVEKFPFEKGGCEDVTTESGKRLTLQAYHVCNPGQ